jgi:hypothetical protein
VSDPFVTSRTRIGGSADHNAIAVYVSREASLDVALTEVARRRLRSIDIVVRDGFSNEQTYSLSRGAALKLYHALGDSIMATKDDPESWSDEAAS